MNTVPTPAELLPYLGREIDVKATLLSIEAEEVCRILIKAYISRLREEREQEIICEIKDIKIPHHE